MILKCPWLCEFALILWPGQWPWQWCLTLVSGIPDSLPPGQDGLKYAQLVPARAWVVTEIQGLQRPSLITLRAGEVAQLIE